MALLDRIHRELSKSLIKRGVLGTLKSALALVVTKLGERVAKRRPANRRRTLTDPFDERFGVDTAGSIRLGALHIASANWIHGQSYEPIGGAPDFQSLLDPTGVDIASATFVDLGSGKGRAVMLAAQLPFKRVVGVEFSDELNSIAEKNLQRFPEAERRCRDVSVTLGDAAHFAFPDGPLVIYLYNPFETPVMQQVVAHVAAAYRAQPRPIVVLYFTPLYVELWRDLDFLEQTAATNDPAIFVSRQAGILHSE
jgi:SAM-dependent methyltransferase